MSSTERDPSGQNECFVQPDGHELIRHLKLSRSCGKCYIKTAILSENHKMAIRRSTRQNRIPGQPYAARRSYRRQQRQPEQLGEQPVDDDDLTTRNGAVLSRVNQANGFGRLGENIQTAEGNSSRLAFFHSLAVTAMSCMSDIKIFPHQEASGSEWVLIGWFKHILLHMEAGGTPGQFQIPVHELAVSHICRLFEQEIILNAFEWWRPILRTDAQEFTDHPSFIFRVNENLTDSQVYIIRTSIKNALNYISTEEKYLKIFERLLPFPPSLEQICDPDYEMKNNVVICERFETFQEIIMSPFVCTRCWRGLSQFACVRDHLKSKHPSFIDSAQMAQKQMKAAKRQAAKSLARVQQEHDLNHPTCTASCSNMTELIQSEE